MSFKWKEDYCLNIDEIDAQHKRLLEIGDEVYDIAILDDGYDHYDEIMTVIDKLLEYTEYHFSYEEKMLKELNYKELHDQEEEHYYYIYKIKSIASREDIDDNQRKTILELLDFLSQWITNHIMVSDRKYADYLKQK
ncbi:bacteriohemerythrin [Clostridium magnum]|uniref:Bacteriohemerythrin n=1 Tax=Clostridium magnum DSM 2767 TaxID=1121326 RepID=A0A161XB57_9CLOT|nr:bacteriohemerythrin [Clostridium magnum]KZL91506.1 bacteriohemerythrin [Clostridium magnum DSM 2767]SHH45229.1 hemerythrin-like metal-binding domain protein [Clostridium magnum DSM 2767]